MITDNNITEMAGCRSSVIIPGIAGVVLTLTGTGTVCGILSVLTAGQRGKWVGVLLPLEHLAAAPEVFLH